MSDEEKNEELMEPTGFDNLPDVLLFKIFSYLYAGDLCRAGRVCFKWYKLSRCQVLWRKVDTHDMQLSTHQVQKLVPILPSCVTYLRICSFSTQQRIPILAPHTAIEIRERCPQLKTLILESAFIAKHINFTDITVEDLPQKLSVLSLRKSFFHTDQFFCSISHPTIPKIKVLDCCDCWCVRDTDLPFFSRLNDLQEIYLAGCQISDTGITTLLTIAPNIKVLDLESTNIGGETLSYFGQKCYPLEKLFIANTKVTDEHICALSGRMLPKLQEMCLRKTNFTEIGLKHVLIHFITLKYLSVSPNVSTKETLELATQNARVRHLVFNVDHADDLEYCDHFFLRDGHPEV